jgi:hypothetical protein
MVLTGSSGGVGDESAHPDRGLADDGNALDAEGVALLQRLQVEIAGFREGGEERVEAANTRQAPPSLAVWGTLGASEQLHNRSKEINKR